MGRTRVSPIKQPDETTCGPAAIKIALRILGVKKSLNELIKLCRTNRNGTSTKNMIRALTTLGYYVKVVEYATLHHLQSALKRKPTNARAILVSYLYRLYENGKPKPTSGHWAVVSAYSIVKERIYVLDSYSGRKKSYPWKEFRIRWMDYDLKRRHETKNNRGKHTFRLIRKWQKQMIMVVAKSGKDLPNYRNSTQKVYIPGENV